MNPIEEYAACAISGCIVVALHVKKKTRNVESISCFLKNEPYAMLLLCNSRRRTTVNIIESKLVSSKNALSVALSKNFWIDWNDCDFYLNIFVFRMVYYFAAIGNWELEHLFGKIKWEAKPYHLIFCQLVREIWIL